MAQGQAANLRHGFLAQTSKSLFAYGYRPWEVDLDYPEVKSDTKIVVRTVTEDNHRVPAMVSLGCHVGGYAPPHADPSDQKTMIAGCCKRFAREIPKMTDKHKEGLAKFTRQFVEDHFVPLSTDSDVSVESWLEKTSYPAWRSEELSLLWKERSGILEKKDFICKSFMKDETYGQAFKHARGINARSDMFKCAVGPIFKLIEKEVFKHPAFIKYVPVHERPAYIMDRLYAEDTKYVATDYTAYESHFTRDVMENCEFILYEHMTKYLPGGAEFMALCRDVIAGSNVAQYKTFDVFVSATRMSGEMNTSLGNGFANLMLFMYACNCVGSECVGVIEGDDGLNRVKGPIPTTELFEEMGFTIKLDVHDQIETASFCGILFDTVDLVNVTDPRSLLLDFGWAGTSYTPCKRKRHLELLRAKSLSYLHQYSGCPIAQELALYGLRITKHIDLTRFITKSRNLGHWQREKLIQALERPGVARPVPQRTRALVEQLYGVDIAMQLSIEKYLSQLNHVQELWHWTFQFMFTRETMIYWDNYVGHEFSDCVKRYSGQLDVYEDKIKFNTGLNPWERPS